MELGQEQGVPVVCVTEAPLELTRAYLFEGGYTFPVLAEAAPAFDAWGIGMIWGSVVRLVDPDGRVVAAGLPASRRVLLAR